MDQQTKVNLSMQASETRTHATPETFTYINDALKGGSAVDNYFTERAQVPLLLEQMNAVATEKDPSGGFKQAAIPGTLNGLPVCEFVSGDTGVLVGQYGGESAANQPVTPRAEPVGYVTYRTGGGLTHSTFIKCIIDLPLGPLAGQLLMRNVFGPLMYNLGNASLQSFLRARGFVKVEPTGANSADDLNDEAGAGATEGGQGTVRIAWAAEDGGEATGDMAVVWSGLGAVAGFVVVGVMVAIPFIFAALDKAISHTIVLNNFTTYEDLNASVPFIDEGTLQAAPKLALSSNGFSVPGYKPAGQTNGPFGVTTSDPLYGEATFHFINTNALKGIGYVISIMINNTKIYIGFDIPFSGDNSVFIQFNPTQSAEDWYDDNDGSHKTEHYQVNDADSGLSIAASYNALSGGDHEDPISGATGYFYKSVITIWETANAPSGFIPPAGGQCS